jgi:hypothetical protein
LRGWDDEGFPTLHKLNDLGLRDITPIEVTA